jgi:hypothetical protein
MWQRALRAAHLSAEFISAESLGRNGPSNERRALIIVDEAHHFRNSCTRRYSMLARMCMLTPVLLLTATPLHNSRDDLSAIIAIFKGSRAYSMSDAEFASMIVRRTTVDRLAQQRMPLVEHAPPRRLVANEAVLDMILALPPPVPPSDGGIATRLVMHGLVRQWVSSNAALIGALRRRIARSHGLLASLEAGRYPTAAELSAWVYTGDAVQLAFAELLVPASTPLDSLATALREHLHALGELLAFARTLKDDCHAQYIREIKALSPNEKIVAFTCYAETAEAAYRSLERDGRAALLTARGGMIASGSVSRATVMRQFAPPEDDHPIPRAREVINLLITTDLLSEGVDLQEASIVIHLDVPWTQARIDQRIGRLARMGSRHDRVMSYSMIPSERADRFLHELEIIARKSGLAAQLFGVGASAAYGAPAPSSVVASGERTRVIMDAWRGHELTHGATASSCWVCGAKGRRTTAVGAWLLDGVFTLLEWDPVAGIRNDPRSVEAAIEAASTCLETGEIVASTVARILTAADAWYERRAAWLAAGGDDSLAPATLTGSRRMLARVADATSSTSSFARRTQSAAIATRLRAAAASPLPIAVEWSLESLSVGPDDASVNTILDLVDSARSEPNRPTEPGFRCVALVLVTSSDPPS